jgi:hypothetical protein
MVEDGFVAGNEATFLDRVVAAAFEVEAAVRPMRDRNRSQAHAANQSFVVQATNSIGQSATLQINC